MQEQHNTELKQDALSTGTRPIWMRYISILPPLLVFGCPIGGISLYLFFERVRVERPEWAQDDFALFILCLMLTPLFSIFGVILAHIIRWIERKAGNDAKDKLYVTLITGYIFIVLGVCFYALLYALLA